MSTLAQRLKKHRVHAGIKRRCLFITPPLCITEDILMEGLDKVRLSLEESYELTMKVMN